MIAKIMYAKVPIIGLTLFALFTIACFVFSPAKAQVGKGWEKHQVIDDSWSVCGNFWIITSPNNDSFLVGYGYTCMSMVQINKR